MTTTKKTDEKKPMDVGAYLNQRIPFMAPLLKKDEPDLYVAVNGRSFQIQRGKTVMLPRYVVEHLSNVSAQQAYIIQMQAAMQQNVDSEQLK